MHNVSAVGADRFRYAGNIEHRIHGHGTIESAVGQPLRVDEKILFEIPCQNHRTVEHSFLNKSVHQFRNFQKFLILLAGCHSLETTTEEFAFFPEASSRALIFQEPGSAFNGMVIVPE